MTSTDTADPEQKKAGARYMRAGKRKGMVKMESPKTVVPILKFLNKFPAGTMLIPMLICAAINTWLPGVLDIGGPTTAMFKKGTLCIAGIMLFISGAKLSVRQIKLFAKVGGVYLVLKLIICTVVRDGGRVRHIQHCVHLLHV